MYQHILLTLKFIRTNPGLRSRNTRKVTKYRSQISATLHVTLRLFGYGVAKIILADPNAILFVGIELNPPGFGTVKFANKSSTTIPHLFYAIGAILESFPNFPPIRTGHMVF